MYLSDCFVTYVKSIMDMGQNQREHLSKTIAKLPLSPDNIQRDLNSLPISENFPVYTNKYRMIIIIYFDLVLRFIKTMKLHP